MLKIANGYLPRVRLEYDRLKAELNSWEAESNSLKAAVNNSARTYQDFCDRNLKLKKREDELQLSINELEAKMAELNESSSQTLFGSALYRDEADVCQPSKRDPEEVS